MGIKTEIQDFINLNDEYTIEKKSLIKNIKNINLLAFIFFAYLIILFTCSVFSKIPAEHQKLFEIYFLFNAGLSTIGLIYLQKSKEKMIKNFSKNIYEPYKQNYINLKYNIEKHLNFNEDSIFIEKDNKIILFNKDINKNGFSEYFYDLFYHSSFIEIKSFMFREKISLI